MEKNILTSILISMLFLNSCGSEEIIKIENGNVCEDKYKNKKLQITGKILMPKSIVTTGRMNVNAQVGGTKQLVTLSFSTGKEANKMEKLPQNFTEKDIKIYNKDNKGFGVGDQITVVGTMISATSNWCQLNVEEVQ